MPIDLSKIPPDQPSLWDKANTPLLQVGGDPTTQAATEQLAQEHPYIGATGKFLTDALSGLTTPLSLGLGALSGGAATSRLLIDNPAVQAGLRLFGMGVGGAQVASGGRKIVHALHDKSGPEALSGALEAGMGGLGLVGHGMTPVPEDPNAPPNFSTQKGLRVALDSLKSKAPGPIDPSTGIPVTDTTPEEIQMHRALDAATLRNKRGPLAQEIYGEQGRPDAIGKDLTPSGYQGDYTFNKPGELPIVSRGLSITDAQKAWEQANAMDQRAASQQNRAQQQQWSQEAKNETARQKYRQQNLKDADKQTVAMLQNGLANMKDEDKAWVQGEKSDAAQTKRTAQKWQGEAKNLNARDKYLQDVEDQENAATSAALKQRDADWAQEAKNENARQTYLQNQRQQAALDKIKAGLTNVLEPGTVRETISGEGPNGERQSATRLYTKPKGNNPGGESGGDGSNPPDEPIELMGKEIDGEANAARAARTVNAKGYVPTANGKFRLVKSGNPDGMVAAPGTPPKGSLQAVMDKNSSWGKLTPNEQISIIPHLEEAVNGDFDGDINNLANRLAEHYADFRDFNKEAQTTDYDSFLNSVRKAGGIVPGKGDAADVVNVIKNGFKGIGQGSRVGAKAINGLIAAKGKVGLNPDAMVEHLNENGFNIKDQKDLASWFDRAAKAAARPDLAAQYDSYLHGTAGDKWWHDPAFQPKGIVPEISTEDANPPSEAHTIDVQPPGRGPRFSPGEVANANKLGELQDAIHGGEAPTKGNGVIPVRKSAPIDTDEGFKDFSDSLDALAAEEKAKGTRPAKGSKKGRFNTKAVPASRDQLNQSFNDGSPVPPEEVLRQIVESFKKNKK